MGMIVPEMGTGGRKAVVLLSGGLFAVAISAWQAGPRVATAQSSSTRPPEGIERGLRPLSPSEIPPNLSFYTLDPLYEPGRPLGWAKEPIEERLDRGMLALAREGGGVYLGWLG